MKSARRSPAETTPSADDLRTARLAKALAPKAGQDDRAEAAAAREAFRKGFAEKHERAHALRLEALAKNEEARRLFLEMAKHCWSNGYALDADEYERNANACAPKGTPPDGRDHDFLDD